ncbi:hypothetical protein [Thermochromatium tepidum]|uniref:PEP-CTERM sorting domain-containing protein n=1 Tax=Thermochromatium tepidum ATCC 43061 TaxID=316276 RepID=A0A6I6EFS1_THETI|nr:hypothetical protein [Thermochromatium tepidum]QGU33809.1 hypothetical protein E6P07_12985 [Thermochromatium tepidum ATCC 43061]
MFAKNTLASAVAAAIGVSAVGVAQADTVFFPYAALSPTVTTIVSVINTTDDNWNQSGAYAATHLHYRFYYKNIAAGEGLLNNCEEYNEYLPTSRNDIQTIDLGGVFGSNTAGVLFNDPSVNNRWQQSGRDYALGRNVQPARGYLTVDNSDGTIVDLDGDDGETLAGEAFVFEFGSGAAWGYQAYSSDDADFRFAASQSPSPVALMPFNEITTAFFVTPVSIDQTPDFANDYRARIEFVTTARGDLYDRDENLISGTVPQDVVCVGRINASSLLSDGTAARLVNGGWGQLWNYRLVFDAAAQKWVRASFELGGVVLDHNYNPTTATFNPTGSSDSANLPKALNNVRENATPGAVVIKLEYNTSGTFNGEAVGGTYNNAILFTPDENNPF